MKKYVLIYYSNSELVFSMRDELNQNEKEVINKNFPFSNIFYYDYKYFKRKINSIYKILLEVARKNKINKIIVENNELIDLVINVYNILRVPYFHILVDTALSFNQYERILTNKRLKYISCYYMPPVYLNKFSRRNIQINLRLKKELSEDFLLSIDCFDYDTLYFKESVVLKTDGSRELKDFEEFIKINKNLRSIHLYSFNEKFIEKIINILREYNRQYINIYLHQDNYDEEYIKSIFKNLKDINREYYKKMYGEIKIIYSNKYIRNNLFKQLSFNNLKIIFFIVAYICIIAVFFQEFYFYISKSNIDKLNEEINNVPLETEDENEITDEAHSLKEVFSTLLEINDETVGWLTVNNTNINYPIVQHSDNDYYLHRNFYKTKTSSGWVFMDYRNSTAELDDNTIIFGHRLKDNTMFGSLDNVIYSDWYTNKENLTVKFNTLNKNMNWQVFSIYRVEYTIDYLKTEFQNKQEFDEFINLITNRSVYNFKVSIDYGDKILTLSTCVSYNDRLVLHAKLIE